MRISSVNEFGKSASPVVHQVGPPRRRLVAQLLTAVERRSLCRLPGEHRRYLARNGSGRRSWNMRSATCGHNLSNVIARP